MAELHRNPLKLSHYPNIMPDFVGAAVKEAIEQRDAALAEIKRLRDYIVRLRELDASVDECVRCQPFVPCAAHAGAVMALSKTAREVNRAREQT